MGSEQMARSSQRSCVVHRRDATICGEHPEIRLSQLCFCNQSYSSHRGEYSFINRVYGSRGTNGLTGSCRLGPLRRGPVGIEPTAAERGGSNLKGLKDFWRTNGSSQVQIQDLTVLCVPNSLNSGERLRVGWLQGFNSL